ncbi:long-chain fatty acid--CoA ligase [Desulfosarcina ovata subsp. sediminis]|uniref:Long-chain fatty acid--CoA ligase n=1 Tax=Desulfosarcina ovata subsp. sediminis TaxID=885957 RepID=A0A5K7ZZG9_9BACT|nr:class I adenylate-forming enzyme family protein [Desulfosarcina ovata]BBO85500.1 long-chain fatty acid--CoA ligase [Desulfosarcina ovata subsp. sediminis]
MLITEILARNARMYGQETALIEREPALERRREITWKAFDEQASTIAQVLIARGVRKGDRVIHLMMNCLEWLPAYFGILRTGAWAVPLNFRFVAETIANCSLTAEARVFIFGEEFIDRVDQIREQIQSCVQHFIFTGPEEKRPDWAESLKTLMATHPAEPPSVKIDICDDAALYFTSGTTGTPKATRLTHRNLEHACYVENRHHNQVHTDNFLCIPPLYHTGAKMHWFGNFIVGARAVILKGIDPRWIIEAISEEQVTIVWLLVPWALDLLFAIESGELKLTNYRLDQWRLMHIGAQPVPSSLIREWQKIFPNHQYDTNYGLTECTGPGCIHLGLENMHKVGAIGVPGFDWEYQIVDDDHQPVMPGNPGELILKGPGVMKEYYQNPEATAATIVDGWLLTGDVARQDEDGFIWLVDRKKDVIITGGENIYPVEIEAFLMGHPRIQDVAVIGLPSLRLGEIATAIIKVKNGAVLTKEEVDDFCSGLARYKRPRKIIFADVPRNPTGKIEKPRLREQYAGKKESFQV